ncbi:hypothetical protein AUJ15_02930 [Candidatus Micrarchaeota archaeon CG1_02_55_41]|nr:MAG: hypothetical protein AUJ15_02930 [Candidatus Micrarchaeota archaeon CG1_02_55_41]
MAQYTVKQGDSWERIAGKMTGNQRQFLNLASYNDFVNLQPGMVIDIPEPEQLPETPNIYVAPGSELALAGYSTSAEIADWYSTHATGEKMEQVKAATGVGAAGTTLGGPGGAGTTLGPAQLMQQQWAALQAREEKAATSIAIPPHYPGRGYGAEPARPAQFTQQQWAALQAREAIYPPTPPALRTPQEMPFRESGQYYQNQPGPFEKIYRGLTPEGEVGPQWGNILRLLLGGQQSYLRGPGWQLTAPIFPQPAAGFGTVTGGVPRPAAGGTAAAPTAARRGTVSGAMGVQQTAEGRQRMGYSSQEQINAALQAVLNGTSNPAQDAIVRSLPDVTATTTEPIAVGRGYTTPSGYYVPDLRGYAGSYGVMPSKSWEGWTSGNVAQIAYSNARDYVQRLSAQPLQNSGLTLGLYSWRVGW